MAARYQEKKPQIQKLVREATHLTLLETAVLAFSCPDLLYAKELLEQIDRLGPPADPRHTFVVHQATALRAFIADFEEEHNEVLRLVDSLSRGE